MLCMHICMHVYIYIYIYTLVRATIDMCKTIISTSCISEFRLKQTKQSATCAADECLRFCDVLKRRLLN